MEVAALLRLLLEEEDEEENERVEVAGLPLWWCEGE
jgi:hypothetical protein